MTREILTCARAPCRSCPYRRDVPSGVWAADEYDKLPGYDGTMADQITAGAAGLFMCHQQDGKLCAGWVGCHGPDNLAALRLLDLNSDRTTVDPSVWTYESPVPLFASGAAAQAHGKRAIRRPGKAAVRTIGRLMRKRRRDRAG
jgi:hypothetical protein